MWLPSFSHNNSEPVANKSALNAQFNNNSRINSDSIIAKDMGEILNVT